MRKFNFDDIVRRNGLNNRLKERAHLRKRVGIRLLQNLVLR